MRSLLYGLLNFCFPEPTRILKQPEYKVVQKGMSAVFECKVKHDPSLIPIMTWLKDNGELPDDERYETPSGYFFKHDIKKTLKSIKICGLQVHGGHGQSDHQGGERRR